jgi:hypothetical protein
MAQPTNTEATSLIQKDDGYGGTSNVSSDDVEDGGYNKDFVEPSGKLCDTQHWVQKISSRISHPMTLYT